MKRFLRLAVMVGMFWIADSPYYLWAKPAPGPMASPLSPEPSSAGTPVVKREKPKTPLHVYVLAGSVVGVATFGLLAAVYFARKQNIG